MIYLLGIDGDYTFAALLRAALKTGDQQRFQLINLRAVVLRGSWFLALGTNSPSWVKIDKVQINLDPKGIYFFRPLMPDEQACTKHHKFIIPESVKDIIISATKTMGLVLAGWDFKVDKMNTFWCLEANPMPGFGPYDDHLGNIIADEIIQVLLSSESNIRDSL